MNFYKLLKRVIYINNSTFYVTFMTINSLWPRLAFGPLIFHDSCWNIIQYNTRDSSGDICLTKSLNTY